MKTKLGFLLVVFIALLSFTLPMMAQDDTAAQGDMIPATLGDITGDSATYYGETVIVEGVIDHWVSAHAFALGEGALLFDSQVLVINNTGQPLPHNIFAGDRVVVTGVVHPSWDESGMADEGAVVPDPVEGAEDAFEGAEDAVEGVEGVVATPSGEDPLGAVDDPAAGDAGAEMTPEVGDTGAVDPAAGDAGQTDMQMTPEGGDAGAEMTPETGDTGQTGTDMEMNPETGPVDVDLDSSMGGIEDQMAFFMAGNFPDDYNHYTILELTSIENINRIDTDEGM